ncbi:unnamed protein product [Caenorhabditis brenneri]
MIAQSKKVKGKKSGLSVFWSISGGYVMSGDEKYPVERFNILDRRDRTVVIYWPLTKRENVHEKRTETFSDGEADDVAAPVVPVGRAPHRKRATATSRAAPTRATPIRAGERTAPRKQSPTPMPRIRGAHWDEPVVSNKKGVMEAKLEELDNKADRMKKQMKQIEAMLSQMQKK